MKVLTVFNALLVIVASVPSEKLLAEKWTNFKTNFGKTYSTFDEESKRFAIYKVNLQKIEAHNQLYEAGKSTYRMGVNKFTDWSAEEMSKHGSPELSKNEQRQTKKIHKARKDDVIPDEVDWRKNGSVTAVKDQDLLFINTSIPFQVTGAVEGQYQISSGKLISLSEKQFMDCETMGVSADLFYYYISLNGIKSEDSYPIDNNDTCRANSSNIVTHIMKDYVKIGENEKDLVSAVATVGPTAVLMESTENLYYYESGILDDDMCIWSEQYLNHGALVIGYGTENGTKYWIVKNSWGSSWGEEGYFRMIRNEYSPCGINDDASYPVLPLCPFTNK